MLSVKTASHSSREANPCPKPGHKLGWLTPRGPGPPGAARLAVSGLSGTLSTTVDFTGEASSGFANPPSCTRRSEEFKSIPCPPDERNRNFPNFYANAAGQFGWRQNGGMGISPVSVRPALSYGPVPARLASFGAGVPGPRAGGPASGRRPAPRSALIGFVSPAPRAGSTRRNPLSARHLSAKSLPADWPCFAQVVFPQLAALVAHPLESAKRHQIANPLAI